MTGGPVKARGALEVIRKYWGAMLEVGATTFCRRGRQFPGFGNGSI